MPAKRELTMRQIRELIRLDHEGVGAREIGRRLGIARNTVQDNLHCVRLAGLTWPLPPALTDEVLEQKLFQRPGVKAGVRQHTEPDWGYLAREMKRAGVNLTLLWEEYRQRDPGGYSYSRFCDLFRQFERRLSPVMRQHHVAGDKLFVDYSGKKLQIINPATGAVHGAELFVAVLGTSNYTYAEATWTQSLPDWIGAHIRMFRFYAGVPRLLVPDNLKAGVNKPSFYDPEVNRSYAMMAAHYDVGIWPARPRKPKDKAKVEAGVRFAQTYILGRLRNHRFFSLQECNAAIRAALIDMNGRPMRRLGISRQPPPKQPETLDRVAIKRR
jgi:transposase